MSGEPWALAVADANEEDVPASAEDAICGELACLWNDLDTAIRDTIHGRFTAPDAWSMHALDVAGRIIVLSRLVGATPWQKVGCNRILDGTYHGLLSSAGIEHSVPGEDDMRQIREWVEGQREAARRPA